MGQVGPVSAIEELRRLSTREPWGREDDTNIARAVPAALAEHDQMRGVLERLVGYFTCQDQLDPGGCSNLALFTTPHGDIVCDEHRAEFSQEGSWAEDVCEATLLLAGRAQRPIGADAGADGTAETTPEETR